MTQRNNNLSAGTQGTALSASNAGGTGNTNFSAAPILTNGSTITFDNTHGGIGGSAYLLKYSPTSGGSCHHRWTGFSATTYKASTYLWIDTLPTADLWLRTFTAGGTTALRITLQSGGRIRITDTRGTTQAVWQSAAAVLTGQLVRIDTTIVPGAAGAGRVVIGYYAGNSSTPVEAIQDTSNNSVGSAPIDTDIMGKTDTSTYASPFWMGGFRSDDAPADTTLLGPWPYAGSTPVRPAGVISNPGVYTNVGGAASLAAALADESDSTYVQSPDNPAGAQISFGPQTDKLSAGLVTVASRDSVTDASRPAATVIDLMEGATVRSSKSFNVTAVYPTWQIDQWTLTQTESDSIQDRNALWVRYTDTVS